MKQKTSVTLLVLLLASLAGSVNLIPPVSADDGPFLVGSQLGDNWRKDTYSDETVRLTTPVKTYLEGARWTLINTTITPSDSEYDFEVTRGRYHLFLKSNPSLPDMLRLFIWLDGNRGGPPDVNITLQPLGIGYRNTVGDFQSIATPVDADIGRVVRKNIFAYPNLFPGLGIDLGYRYEAGFFEKIFRIPNLNGLPVPTIPNAGLAFDFRVKFTLGPDTAIDAQDLLRFLKNSRVLARLVPPFAVDAAGAHVGVRFARGPVSGGQVDVTFVVPGPWLANAARVFPVLVDPSLTIQPSEIDSYVDELSPVQNFGTIDSIYVQSTVGSITRSFVQFNISTIPEDATITTATLGLNKFGEGGSFPRTYTARRVTASWSETVITWDNQPATTVVDEVNISVGGTGQFYNWTVTSIVTDWFDGTESNYGFRVNDTDESGGGHFSQFRSREHAVTTERPRLEVVYTEVSPTPFNPAWLTISYFNGFGGLGLPFFTFQTRYENATGSHRVPFVPFPVEPSETINITTFDFLGNEIDRQDGFTIGAADTYAIIDISINIAQVFLIFSDGEKHLHEFRDLDSGRTTLAYDTPTLLFADRNYSYEVFEDDAVEAIAATNLTDLIASVHVFEVNVRLKDVEIRYSLFDAATGEGLPFTTFPIFADYVRLRTPFTFTRTGANVNTAVRDFFGNEIYNVTQNATTNPFFWDIPITVYSWKLTNADLFDYVLSNLTYNGSGVGRAEFVGAGETIAYWLRSGDYTLNLTYYEMAVITGTDQVFFSIASAQAYTVTGNRSIQRVVDGVGGVGDNVLEIWNRANQTFERVGDLDTPAGVAIIYDSYYVPPMSVLDLVSKDQAPGITIDPFRTVIYDILNTSEGTGRLLLYQPYSTGWDDDDVTLMRDELHLVVISGSLTRLWINNTQGTDITSDDTIVLNITYTGFIDLTQYGDGLNLSLETEGTASVNATRVSQVRYISAFLWTQDTTTREYTMTTNLENTIDRTWTSVTIYIAFPQETDPDSSTVVVRDVSAAIDLEKGIHYDLTDGGVYLALTSIVPLSSTTWRVTFFDTIIGTAILEPRCSFGQITSQPRGLVTMQRLELVCVNENPFNYQGRLVIVFDLALAVDHNEIIIERVDGTLLPNSRYWNDANTLIIVGVGLSSLSTLQLVVWFRYVSDSLAVTDFLPYLPFFDLVFASFAIIGFWFWSKEGKGGDRRERARVVTILFGIAAVMTFVIIIYLQASLGI